MKFARIVFLFAGVFGLLLLLPQYFLEGYNARNFPPPVTHPEYFYGFVGVAAAFQIVFIIISRDPVRFRPMMLAGVAEKFSFGIACVALFALGRVGYAVVVFGAMDLTLGVLFAAAYRLTGEMPAEAGA